LVEYSASEDEELDEDSAQESVEGGQHPDVSDDAEEEEPSKQKRKRAAPIVYEMVDEWEREGISDADIQAHIRGHLYNLNKEAGLLHVPGAHRDRVSIYGDWVFRYRWVANKGLATNILLDCPLRKRCGCTSQCKITELPTKIVLYVNHVHTAEDHVIAKDTAKHLKMQQKQLIRDAVKICPSQSAKELMRNIGDSPTKAIGHEKKKSVERLVRAERARMLACELEGVTVDNSIGSLASLAEAMWFGDAIVKHCEGQCLDIFKVFIIGRQILEGDRTVFLTFATTWDLLNLFRALASGYEVQLMGDVTSKASSAALNKLGLGVNMLGNRFAPLSFTLIPAETESAAVYAQAYAVTKSAIRRIISLPTCGKAGCITCTSIAGMQDEELVQCCLASPPYEERKELPIDIALGDNSTAWQKFTNEELHLPSNVCQTHATAIAKNNGTHRKYFNDMNVYEDFYEYVCRIMRCPFENAGRRLQQMLIEWLDSKEETRARDWFGTYWCGEPAGRWLLADSRIGMTPNNQGIESTWRWDRESISRGRQVIHEIYWKNATF
jgi:hypothetical protein